MFIILSYDIGHKRVGKALKVCRKYLRHTHRSVFEGELTEAKLMKLEHELKEIIDTKHDSICVYRVPSPRLVYKEQIGVVEQFGEIV